MQPIILAGGIGSRLWPLSRYNIPKQFIKFFGNHSFFQKTILRLSSFDMPIVICNIVHKDIVTQQLKDINKQAILIVEPEISNTYIPFLVGAAIASSRNRSNLGFFPCDHHINCNTAFLSTILRANQEAKKDQIVTIGILANKVDRKYGHIISKKLKDNTYKTIRFIEKPTKNEDHFMYDSPQSHIHWNTGVYLASNIFFMKYFQETLLMIKKQVQYNQQNKIVYVPLALYKKLPHGSFDKNFMSNLRTFNMVEAGFKWLDIGSYKNLIIFYIELFLNSLSKIK